MNNWTTDEQIIEHQLAVIDGLKARIEELVEANLNLESECVASQKRIDEQSKLLNFADHMCNLDNSKVLELQAKVNDLNARHNETLNRFEGCLLRNAKMKNENKILVGRIQHLEELLWGVP